MNQTTKFEDRLLDELKSVVVSREAERKATKRRFGWKPGLALAGALAAATAICVPVVIGTDAQPAWSVERTEANTVWVKIRRPEDPRGLERELEKYVPNVSVDMPPAGSMCEPGWYEPKGGFAPGSYEWGNVKDPSIGTTVIAKGFDTSQLNEDTTLIVHYDRERTGKLLDIAKGQVGHCPVVPDNK